MIGARTCENTPYVLTNADMNMDDYCVYDLRSFLKNVFLVSKICKIMFGHLVQLYQISTFICTDFGTEIPEIK